MNSVDVIVVGGGINGAGIAQCAAAAGLSVLLLEQGMIAGQTSTNSSKLIHGGLRYLETGQLSLVRKSLAERRALLTLAPSLVKPVKFYIPVYEDSQRSPWAIRAGLSMYALLSELDPLGQFKSIPAVKWPELAGLKMQGLKAVFQYWDAQTDDKLLTQAVAKSARTLGAKVLELAECTAIEHKPNEVVVDYQHQGVNHTVTASKLINAAGPWVNKLLERVSPPIAAEPIDWVQGSHVLLDIEAPDGILYLESCFDERVVFVMPWYGQILVGTTETLLNNIDVPPEITADEIDYLLGIYLHYFPQSGNLDCLKQQIVSTYCGVRVLPKPDSSQLTKAFSRPRDTLQSVHRTHPNIMSIYGGKLTTYRSIAQDAVDWLLRSRQDKGLARPVAIADFDKLSLEPFDYDQHPLHVSESPE